MNINENLEAQNHGLTCTCCATHDLSEQTEQMTKGFEVSEPKNHFFDNR